MITAGIDCGAGDTKTVILKEGRIIAWGKVPTGFDREKAVGESLDRAMKGAGVGREDILKVGGTGTGIGSIRIADVTIDDIKAMAKGAHFFFPGPCTVADVGAEEGRAVRIDEAGSVVDFVINEKCAAGAGAFIESMARALEVRLEEMGPLCLQSDRRIPMNAQCAVFAESEVVGLIHAKTEKRDISRAVHDAIAGRIASMIRRVGVSGELVMLGGVAHNPGFVETIRRELKLDRILIPDAPEFGAAVGAAVAAAEEA
jgi:benzoyl-CoA reductase subunit D